MSKLPIVLVAFVPALCLCACGGGNPAADVVIETITVDATTVQAAAPPSGGNTTSGKTQGLLAYVKDSAPTRLVLLCHGYGTDVLLDPDWARAMADTVRPDTAVLAMNYRDNLRFPVLRGAHDVIAATQLVQVQFPTIRKRYLFGLSMGGAITGTALTESAHATGNGALLYDYWIDAEGVNELSEMWTWVSSPSEADNALAVRIKNDIENEAGGTPDQVPTEYERRSPDKRVNEMHSPTAGTGLRALAVIHSANDGLVLYNQSAELAQAASGVGIPTQFFTIGKDSGQDPGPQVIEIGLAGHGSRYEHPVLRTAFQQLELMLDGTYDETTPYRQCQIDDNGDGTTTEACSPPR